MAEAERRVGVRLTQSRGRIVTLTASGRLLAEAAAGIIHAMAQAELGARWLDDGGQRPVRLGLGFYDSVLPRLDPTAGQPVAIVRTSERGMLDGLRRNELDVVVDATIRPPVGFEAHCLADDRLVALVEQLRRMFAQDSAP